MKHAYIIDNITEGKNVNTVVFSTDDEIKPGQFIMAWAPGINEIPLSFSSLNGIKKITVKIYGEASEYIAHLKRGDYLYYSGPYGKPFTIVPGKKLLIGAGTGIAPLIPLIDDNTYGIISGKTADDIIFERYFNNRLKVVTDDGSYGMNGYVTTALKTLDLNEFDMLYVCGPEIMLKTVYDYIKNMDINAQFSLERSMKCGIGLCDSCSINGYQVCTDGPVFSIEQLKNMDEFGRTRLQYSGKRIYF